MNKGELIEQVAVATGLSKTDAGRAVDALFEAVHGSLVAGEEVRIAGFGAFSVAERAAREGRNPRTGDVVKIGASKAPTFKAGKALKDAVNGASGS